MKLWCQSVSRFKSKRTGYLAARAKIVDPVKDPGTEIERQGIARIGGYTVQVKPGI
jgi:hypothetical protein